MVYALNHAFMSCHANKGAFGELNVHEAVSKMLSQTPGLSSIAEPLIWYEFLITTQYMDFVAFLGAL